MGAATKRCFVGMGIDAAACDAFVALQRRLSRLPGDAADEIKSVATRNFHLTLKFLGDTPEGQLDALCDALSATAAAAGSVGVPTLVGLSAFPSVSRPRAVFAAVDTGRNAVAHLASALDGACAELGFPVDERPREPHVTVARVRRARPRGPLTTSIRDNARIPFGGVDGSRLILFESQLRPQGSLYTSLCELPLGGP